MTIDCITIVGFILAVFLSGVAVGRFVERIDRFIHKSENKEHIKHVKNDRR